MKPEITNSLGDLSPKVISAKDIPVPEKKILLAADMGDVIVPGKMRNGILEVDEETAQMMRLFTPEYAWVKIISDYCESNSILPQDLLDFHREHSGSGLKKKKRERVPFDRQAFVNKKTIGE